MELSAEGLIFNSTDAMALHYRHLVTQVWMRCLLWFWRDRGGIAVLRRAYPHDHCAHVRLCWHGDGIHEFAAVSYTEFLDYV